jgi:hypothetical protein
MGEPVPRFEYRAFGQGFGRVEERIRAGRICENITESEESYLLQPDAYDRNVKLRSGRLELKTLLEEHEGLQRWAPSGQWPFPVTAKDLAGEVFAVLDSRVWGAPGERLDQEALLRHVEVAGREIVRAELFKRRFRFEVAGCAAEIDEILVNGAAVRSVAMESEDPQGLLRAVVQVGLDAYENTAYPLALARILGMATSPRGSNDG